MSERMSEKEVRRWRVEEECRARFTCAHASGCLRQRRVRYITSSRVCMSFWVHVTCRSEGVGGEEAGRGGEGRRREVSTRACARVTRSSVPLG